jgi:hypothetical protein
MKLRSMTVCHVVLSYTLLRESLPTVAAKSVTIRVPFRVGKLTSTYTCAVSKPTAAMEQVPGSFLRW